MAGTSNSSTVPAGGSGIDSLAALAQLLGGTKTTQTGTADTSAISALLPQLLQSPDVAKQIAALFSAAGGQIPGLAAARSNAVGARSGNNSAVQASMDKLLQDTVLKAQAQIAQQETQRQATAGNVAVGLANATRGSNTQSGTNIGKATGILGLLGAVDKFGDSRLGKKAIETGGNALDSLQTMLMGQDPDKIFGGTQLFADAGNNISSDILTGGDALTSGLDLSTAFSPTTDTATGVSNNVDIVDTAPVVDDIINWDLGFKDGGLIGRDNKPSMAKTLQKYSPKGYADGGEVTQSSVGGRVSSAPTYIPELIQRSVVRNSNPLMASLGFSDTSNLQGAVADNTASPGASPGVASDAPGASVGGKAPSLGQLGSMAVSALTANPLGMLASFADMALSPSKSIATPALNAVLSKDPISQLVSLLSLVNNVSSTATTNDDVSQTSTEGVSVNNEGALSSQPTNNSLLGELAGIIGANTASDTGNSSVGVGAGAGGDPGATGDGATGGGGDAAGAGSDSAKDGGKITGKGSGTSDSVPIHVSNGEYVIPADVVRTLGVSFFDSLRSQFHVPAFMQAADTDDKNGDDIG